MICLILPAQHVKAQYVLKLANEQYDLFNYTKAADFYLQAYKKNPTLYVAEHLANCYRLMEDYKNAETWYAIAITLPGALPQDFLRYAQALQNNSKYTEAKVQYTKYYTLAPAVDQKQLKLWITACDSSTAWIKDPKHYDIADERGLNSPQSDWGAVTYGNSIVFTSDRITAPVKQSSKGRPFLRIDHGMTLDKDRYLWTGNDYLRLYQRQIDATASAVKQFAFTTDGTDYHMGAASFSADGTEVYFTLTRMPKKQSRDTAVIKTIKLEIFWSKKDPATNQWAKPLPFAYNNEKWSAGDPYISADGRTLYFVSDMPGGKGGTDIYYCVKNASGNWGKPVNLRAVNTAGNERTPFLYGNKLYFSSDGGVGMGGLDIYRATRRDTTFGPVQNMGYPVNSPQDDFSFLLTTDTTGYLSSNRPGGLGNDDIYSFTQKPAPTFLFEGIVYNKKTNQVIANSTVTLIKNGKVLKALSNTEGKFSFRLDEKSTYKLRGEKKAFLSDNQEVTTLRAKPGAVIHKNLYLDKIELNKAIRLENIYYDFDESYIREDAGIELDKLIKILKENPTIEIELGSHTDSRGTEEYNMALSQARADAAVRYIVDIGEIPERRIKARGYGKTRLLNKCKTGVDCTEAEHQLNRRTEFKITKL